jgi:hypothetical protein
LKNVFQLLLHTAETMVRKRIEFLILINHFHAIQVLVLTCEAAVASVPSASNSGSANNTQLGQTVRGVSYTFPDGDNLYEITTNIKRLKNPKKVVCTADDTYFVFIEEKKAHEVLALYDPLTGEHVHNIKLNYPAYKDITLMVTIPKQPYLIGLIDSEKGIVMNVRDKKVKEIEKYL